MKVRDEAAAKAMSDAIKAGKTEAEAEVLGKIAGLEAENAWYAGEHPKIIEDRDRFRTQLKDAEPFIARGRKAADDEKDTATKLAELQAERERDRQALIAERRENRLRGALTKSGVRIDRIDAALRLVDLNALPYDETAGTFSGLDEAAVSIAKNYPEFVGENKSGSPGNDHAGRGGGAAMKFSDFQRLSPSARMKFTQDGGKVGPD